MRGEGYSYAKPECAMGPADEARCGAVCAGDASMWEEWDVRRSLFDNHMSDSLETNLDYMFKKFGFYLPDAEYLSDPEGLVKYLVRPLTNDHLSNWNF